MRRSVIALFVYLGIAVFFGVYALALFGGTSLMTATTRGLTGLIVMGALGLIAGAACKPSRRPAEPEPEPAAQTEQAQP